MIDNLLFAGGVVGILLTVFLFNKKENQSANLLLSLAFGAYSIDILYAFLIINKFYLQYPALIGWNGVLPFIYSPAIYLYTRVVSSNKKNLEFNYLLHFIPAMVILIASIIGYFTITTEYKLDLLNPDIHKSIFIVIMRSIIPCYGISYIIFSLLDVKKYHQRLKENFSNIEVLKLNWLIYLIFAMALVWALEFVQILLIDVAGKPDNIFYKYIYLLISLIMFLIVYKSLKQPQIFSEVNFNESEKNEISLVDSNGSYIKSGLTDDRMDAIAAKLISLIENEKPYFKSNLSLPDLAELLGVSSHNLSEVINTKLNKSFYDFVNYYRVEEVKKMLNDIRFENYSLLGIGFEAGFNSKTSFNTIFKKYTGITPSEFRKNSKD